MNLLGDISQDIAIYLGIAFIATVFFSDLDYIFIYLCIYILIYFTF